MKKLIAALSMLALFAVAGGVGAQDKAPEKPAAEAAKAEPAKAEAKKEEE